MDFAAIGRAEPPVSQIIKPMQASRQIVNLIFFAIGKIRIRACTF
jgi:hypothetical protein